MELRAENVNYRYASGFQITDICARFGGKITAIIGPNGSGKSTLIKCLANQVNWSGDLYYDDKRIRRSDKDFYLSNLSYLPQTSLMGASVTVFEAILLGLLNELTMFVTKAQERRVEDVINALELGGVAHMGVDELSGGQLQMALLAQAIIKEPKILMLDEPLNHLDVHKKFAFLNCIAKLTAEKEMVAIIVLHDINLAARYADSVVVMQRGAVYAQGKAGDVITKDTLCEVYAVDCELHRSREGRPVVEFVGIAREMSRACAIDYEEAAI
ncbi:MAG: ABC transporter ATP-binding protein [Peptococcaceae bacterium]|nr:ABC transporter ATP-binding protein [Peptococcaceae bacterium]